MKKLLVLGLSACLLFSFTGSAFAASQSNTQAKKKLEHVAAVSKYVKKKVVHSADSSKKPTTHTKKNTVSIANKKVKKAVHKKTTASQPHNA